MREKSAKSAQIPEIPQEMFHFRGIPGMCARAFPRIPRIRSPASSPDSQIPPDPRQGPPPGPRLGAPQESSTAQPPRHPSRPGGLPARRSAGTSGPRRDPAGSPQGPPQVPGTRGGGSSGPREPRNSRNFPEIPGIPGSRGPREPPGPQIPGNDPHFREFGLLGGLLGTPDSLYRPLFNSGVRTYPPPNWGVETQKSHWKSITPKKRVPSGIFPGPGGAPARPPADPGFRVPRGPEPQKWHFFAKNAYFGGLRPRFPARTPLWTPWRPEFR